MPQLYKSILIIFIFRQKYNIIWLRRTETDIFLASVNRTFLTAAHYIIMCILRLYYISAQLALKSVPFYFPMFHIIIPFLSNQLKIIEESIYLCWCPFIDVIYAISVSHGICISGAFDFHSNTTK